MLTDNELEQIRERCEKATAGPWTLAPMHDQEIECPMCEGEGTTPMGVQIDGDGWDCLVQCFGFESESEPNSRFVSNARTDIPALLADLAVYKRALELAGVHYEGNVYASDEESMSEYWLKQAKEKVK